MRTVLLIVVFGVGVLVVPSYATIINVPGDCPTIQAGIDSSSDGDTVLVQPDTYYENINFDGHNIVLGSLLVTTGDTSWIPLTIIDGNDSGSVVTIENGEDSTTVLSGFTVQNGFGLGGGIHCSDSDPVIRNNIITNNTSRDPMGRRGGGIYCINSDLRIEHNMISQNSVANNGCKGAGIYCEYSNPVVVNNIIVDNTVSLSNGSQGGGIYLAHSAAFIVDNYISGNSSVGGSGICCSFAAGTIISNNVISYNYGQGSGGGINCGFSNIVISNNRIIGNSVIGGGAGIYCHISSPLIRNNVISNNSASASGGGIKIDSCDPIMIVNNTVCSNTASSGSGIWCGSLVNASLRNSIVRDNIYCYQNSHIDISYSNILGNWPGVGNINVDPLFRYPTNGDFHLMAIECGDSIDSPCIDVGDLHLLDSLLDCSWGLGTLRSDMGAYGGGGDSISPMTINIPGDFSTIQAGINASWDGDTVLVQPGTYFENIDLSGHDIILGSMFLCTGDQSYIASTIIDGNSDGSVVDFYGYQNISPTIIGFTITNGNNPYGGGIYCAYSSPKIFWNSITGNHGSYYGGGIYCVGSSLIIGRNTINGNYGNNGGGISCRTSSLTIINNTISENLASTGGGLHGRDNCTYTIMNTVFWANSASNFPEIYIQSGSPMIEYCDIQGGWEGVGNIDIDPNFRDPENDNFHLIAVVCGDSVDSPCIDAGRPDIWDDSLDCDWGLGTTRSDMGAYGGNDSMQVGVEIETPTIPTEFSLSQNYPNPFNASTVLRYSLPQPGVVKLVVYNVLGRKVGTVFEGVKQAGTHSAVWDAGDVSSGIYFAVLSSGGRSMTIKMLLIK